MEPQQEPPEEASTKSDSEKEGKALTLFDAVRKLIGMIIPIGGASFLMTAPRMIAVVFLGQRVGSDTIAAYSVSATSLKIVGTSIGIGLTTALDTFASQAFGRNPKSAELGTLFQRGLFICFAVSLPLGAALVFFAHPLVEGVFRSKSLADEATPYLRNSLPLLFSMVAYFCFSSLCDCCKQVRLPLYANLLSTASALITGYLFIFDLVSLIRTAIFNYLVCNTFLAFMIAKGGDEEAFIGIRSTKWWPLSQVDWKEVCGWSRVKEYLSVGIPSTVAGCADIWAWEMLIVFAAWEGNEHAAVLTIMWSVFMPFFYLTTYAVSRAVGVLVGNSLGSGKADEAKMYAKAGVLVAFCSNSLCSLIIYFNCEQLFRLYTADENLIKYATKLAIWMSASNFFDGAQMTLQGIFRGAGRQSEAAGRVLASIWLVGVTASFYLGVRFHMGVTGISIGMVVGAVVEEFLLLERLSKWDWEELAETASSKSEH